MKEEDGHAETGRERSIQREKRSEGKEVKLEKRGESARGVYFKGRIVGGSYGWKSSPTAPSSCGKHNVITFTLS